MPPLYQLPEAERQRIAAAVVDLATGFTWRGYVERLEAVLSGLF
jgi:hypothetical protein